MLLTQSQVSVVASSAVVIFFTFLLFLSGYVYQQQSVRGLQDAIRPRIPQAPRSLAVQDPSNTGTNDFAKSRFFRNERGHVTFTDFNKDVHSAGANINWKRLAHIQLVRNHHDICGAIMVLADLHTLRSPARRVLLFPKEWAEQKKAEKGDVSDPYLDSTRRLMRMAARRYQVELHPVDPVPSADGSETYSLASAFELYGDFDRVLNIETPGLLLDAEPLDAILGFTESTPFAMLHDTSTNDGVHSEDLFLLQPSKTTYAEISAGLKFKEAAGFNDTYLASLFPDPVLLASSNEKTALVRSVKVLHDVEAGAKFNETAFTDDVAYIRFSDPKLPGPEYDVPWADKVAARPKNKGADWAWTSLYGQYAQKRMEICGLDLESWRP
ncbi:unnamed protein product [Zymoseptoria tritici ST99CH_3D7]|uniref:Glycosyltransferase family 8 protein n=1 Tax=Zymoseptoria tritici (strain ST99CH_3D7) TaxID=1276538 RepID=A0A1X7RPJ8_ZYMT9|nr:unnamed protein product [Zymoseptoria tritici ST99CH_3D7]